MDLDDELDGMSLRQSHDGAPLCWQEQGGEGGAKIHPKEDGSTQLSDTW